MKFFKIVLGLIVCIFSTTLNAQTNTTTSGTWSDASVWSAGVPGTGTITANVNHPLEINANIAIGTSGTGVFNIFQSMTDFPGGTAYTLDSRRQRNIRCARWDYLFWRSAALQ